MAVRTLVKSVQDIMRKDTGVDGDAQRISQLCWMFFLKIIDDQDQELELTKDGYSSPIPEDLQWRAWAQCCLRLILGLPKQRFGISSRQLGQVF